MSPSTNAEKAFQYDEKYILKNKEKTLLRHRAYRKCNRTKINETYRLWRLKNKEKAIAHRMVKTAIQQGILMKSPCASCGQSPSFAHHEDYSKPLDIVWLCHRHHMQVHGKRLYGFKGLPLKVKEEWIISAESAWINKTKNHFQENESCKLCGLKWKDVGGQCKKQLLSPPASEEAK